MTRNLLKSIMVTLISTGVLMGTGYAQDEMFKGGYSPNPYMASQGFVHNQYSSQSNGFENHFTTPYGASSNWGMSQSYTHSQQYGQTWNAPYFGTPYSTSGYSTQMSSVQTAGFQNTQSTPFGGSSQWGQSQLTSHTLQATQFGPFGASQTDVSGHSLQYATGGCIW
jgi:hypothetical protein